MKKKKIIVIIISLVTLYSFLMYGILIYGERNFNINSNKVAEISFQLYYQNEEMRMYTVSADKKDAFINDFNKLRYNRILFTAIEVTNSDQDEGIYILYNNDTAEYYARGICYEKYSNNSIADIYYYTLDESQFYDLLYKYAGPYGYHTNGN